MKRGHKRRLKSEWEQIIKEWEASGVSQPQFCISRGVALSTLQYWRKKLKRESQANFVELVPTPLASNESNKEIELVLPHGIVLRVKG